MRAIKNQGEFSRRCRGVASARPGRRPHLAFVAASSPRHVSQVEAPELQSGERRLSRRHVSAPPKLGLQPRPFLLSTSFRAERLGFFLRAVSVRRVAQGGISPRFFLDKRLRPAHRKQWVIPRLASRNASTLLAFLLLELAILYEEEIILKSKLLIRFTRRQTLFSTNQKRPITTHPCAYAAQSVGHHGSQAKP